MVAAPAGETEPVTQESHDDPDDSEQSEGGMRLAPVLGALVLAGTLAACATSATSTTTTTLATIHWSKGLVPPVVPHGGVTVYGGKNVYGGKLGTVIPVLMYLHPAKPEPGTISRLKAARSARRWVNAAGLIVTNVVFGDVTDPGNMTTAPGWVVTLSFPKPFRMFNCNNPTAMGACHSSYAIVSADVAVLSPSGAFDWGTEG